MLSPPDMAKTRFGRFLSSRFCFAPPASRLDLTVPSSPIKSEALREECVNPVWRVALPTQSVDVASQQPCSYFLAACENISTDWCSLEPAAKALTPRQWSVATVSSACQAPRFPWVSADYHIFLISVKDTPQCVLLSLEGMHFPGEFSKSFSLSNSTIIVFALIGIEGINRILIFSIFPKKSRKIFPYASLPCSPFPQRKRYWIVAMVQSATCNRGDILELLCVSQWHAHLCR